MAQPLAAGLNSNSPTITTVVGEIQDVVQSLEEAVATHRTQLGPVSTHPPDNPPSPEGVPDHPLSETQANLVSIRDRLRRVGSEIRSATHCLDV